MEDEILDDEILESELADDALEKRMRKLESEANRILHQSDELLREMNKGKEKQEDVKPEEIKLEE